MMLQYLVILLDDMSASWCHYGNSKTERRPVSPVDLQAGILFAMKHNLAIQFVYPPYLVSPACREAIESIDHVKIAPAESDNAALADVAVVNSCHPLMAERIETYRNRIVIFRTGKRELFQQGDALKNLAGKVKRLNIIITDVDTFTDEDFDTYRQWLAVLGSCVADSKENHPQINLLTDRLLLKKMNSCNAGTEHITLAPDGRFYVCPAFYLEGESESIGDPASGVHLKNPQLYQLDYAPLCRRCDAWHCKRCVWLNRKTTREINTPSHEQCVVAHLERNASEKLLHELKTAGYYADSEIPPIHYLDPYEVIKRF